MMRVQALVKKLEQEIRERDARILHDYPIAAYLQMVRSYPRLKSYQYISPDVKNFCQAVLGRGGEAVLELYHKCLLLSLIVRALETNLDNMKIPDEIRGFYQIDFERITSDIERKVHEPGFYRYPDDKFMKDLGVCSLCLIPAGVQKLDLSTLPLIFLFRNGPVQLVARLRFVLLELGGMSPLFNQHTDSHDPHLMSHFHPDGWRRTYVRFADIAALNPEIRGVYGQTWFIDPQLDKISPKLAYVLHINQSNGATLFRLGPSPQGIADATFKSPRRKELYDKGEYIPQDYMQVWPRKKLIQWAEEQKSMEDWDQVADP
jgi:hypothetical protein